MNKIEGSYDVPIAAGCCYVCRTTPQNETYIDTNTEIEQEGWLFICLNCAKTMGELAGGASSKTHENLLAQIAELKSIVSELQGKAAAFDLFLGKMAEFDEADKAQVLDALIAREKEIEGDKVNA